MTILSVRKIYTHYDDAVALSDVSMTVEKGEIVAVLGANGAGKSTLLRSISGMTKPSQGSIMFNGYRIDSLPTFSIAKMGIAHVPEGRHIFPNMTVTENLLAGAYIASAWQQRRKSLAEVNEYFPILKERGRQLANTLSGGEQQILVIGRAIMGMPRLLMLDEPSLGLAPNWIAVLLEKILEIRSTKGIEILLVEQNASLALQVSDRGYILESGQVTFQGSRDQIANSNILRSAFMGL